MMFESAWDAVRLLVVLNAAWLAVFCAVLWLRSGGDVAPLDWAETSLIRGEVAWFAVAAIGVVALNVASISAAGPAIAADDGSAGEPPVENVSVTARMWAFEISDRELPAGAPVRFTAESADTVHSFAVYGPDGDLLFTRMLVPGTTQEVTHTFDRPGSYTVRCLEYCGRGHSAMQDTLEVTGG